jgi:glycine dehydrogenase
MTDVFLGRHVGPSETEQAVMLKALGFADLEQFMQAVLPEQIKSPAIPKISAFPSALTESEALARLKKIAQNNQCYRSLIGQGYYGTLTPSVIRRNILENPGWYTQYTPYQAEISQGRLEALFNFQTLITRLCALPIANASLLDEATAVAEALAMSWAAAGGKASGKSRALVSASIFPQTLAVLRTRAEALGLQLDVREITEQDFSADVFACILQSPDVHGVLRDVSSVSQAAHQHQAYVILACDPMALVLTRSPGSMQVDIAVGSAQRFGVPLFYGGPHAAFMATTEDFKRLLPGRIVGLSKDAHGAPAYRLALQTREQHIRREKATSNICTAQVLLAVIAGMYAVYHGEAGLRSIAKKINSLAHTFAKALLKAGYKLSSETFFDTVEVKLDTQSLKRIQKQAEASRINLAYDEATGTCRVAFDEAVDGELVSLLVDIFGLDTALLSGQDLKDNSIPDSLQRKEALLPDAVFKLYHSETEFLRYVKRLENRDLSLTAAMIPLGSCTMKLNATSEMYPVSWDNFAGIHPFVPTSQVAGYMQLISDLEQALAELSALPAVSLQPNAGSQGEYAGLLAIRGYHLSRGEAQRRICLIPRSAHGTNPASAVMAGFEVVSVACDEQGNIDYADLQQKCQEHATQLAALMITYPSTHGVFEENIVEITQLVHSFGGQVYMDGANYNALVGWCRPGELGVDVMHFNLHKTFCIPHGGGGPGVGPIAVAEHLRSFLPGDPASLEHSGLAVSASKYGSAGILVIPWMYMAMMGAQGLRKATAVAILNANYIAQRLKNSYPLVYADKHGRVAHECILDLRAFKAHGVEVEDVAKRLMDYAFHAPTVSWPVIGTLMVEPTESEAKIELDRFCDAMISIRAEIQRVIDGEWPKDVNPLKLAPHTAESLLENDWQRPYSRQQAAFPMAELKERKFWPYVGRVDGVYGDRHLVCACSSTEA